MSRYINKDEASKMLYDLAVGIKSIDTEDEIEINNYASGLYVASRIISSIEGEKDIYKAAMAEWKVTDAYPHHVYCSMCNTSYVTNREWLDCGHIPHATYCPHCGSRMKNPFIENRCEYACEIIGLGVMCICKKEIGKCEYEKCSDYKEGE